MENYVGTSGFGYASWKNTFYPEKLPAAQWLAYYATRFGSLELNHTFYRFPREQTLKKQYDAVPADFRFSVKAHKMITHTLRMKAARHKIDEFLQVVEAGLGDKLGCVLFQFPASYTYSEENLDRILENIPRNMRHVVEWRHVSWWNETAREAMLKHGLTFCNISFPGLPDTLYPSGPVFYMRMHGVPKLFQSAYTDAQLKRLARDLPMAEERYIYFNNTMHEAGYTNASALQSYIHKKITGL